MNEKVNQFSKINFNLVNIYSNFFLPPSSAQKTQGPFQRVSADVASSSQ